MRIEKEVQLNSFMIYTLRWDFYVNHIGALWTKMMWYTLKVDAFYKDMFD